MTDSKLLTIDIGTQSVRVVVLDTGGRFVFHKQLPLDIQRIKPRHIEQNAEQIVSATRRLIEDAVNSADNIGKAALAIQRSTVVAWDRGSGEALSPALSWQDTRAADQVESLSTHLDAIKQRSGLMLSPHYGASKLRWLLHQHPKVAEAHANHRLCTGPLVSFVLFQLLRGQPYLCDESNAARTQLWNVHERRWDAQLCNWFNVPADLLPEVKPTHSDYGLLDCPSDIPLQVVCGDQSAAYFGAGELPPHTALINMGTGAFILSVAGEQPVAHPRLLDTLAISSDDLTLYLIEATVNGAGAAIDWAREQWQTEVDFDRLQSYLQADNEPPLFINSVGGLGSPWWRSDFEPFWLPATPACKQNPLPCFAAIIESVAFMLHHNLATLRTAGIAIEQCLVSGGLSRLDGLCQRIADLAEVPVLRNAETEATVMGLASLSNTLPKQALRLDRSFKPRNHPGLRQRYTQYCEAIAQRQHKPLV